MEGGGGGGQRKRASGAIRLHDGQSICIGQAAVLHEPKKTNRRNLLPDFAQALLFERGIASRIAAAAPRAARKIAGISGRTIFTRPTAAMGLIPSLRADLTALQV